MKSSNHNGYNLTLFHFIAAAAELSAKLQSMRERDISNTREKARVSQQRLLNNVRRQFETERDTWVSY